MPLMDAAMKPNPKPENDESLRAMLCEWKVNAKLPPRFQEQVWRDIARAEKVAKFRMGRALKQWLEACFSRPAPALAYACVLLTLGLSLGYLRAHEESAQAEAQWRVQYVQTMDAFENRGN